MDKYKRQCRTTSKFSEGVFIKENVYNKGEYTCISISVQVNDGYRVQGNGTITLFTQQRVHYTHFI